MALTIKVEGAEAGVDVNGDTPPPWVFRDGPDMAGAKFGRGMVFRQ